MCQCKGKYTAGIITYGILLTIFGIGSISMIFVSWAFVGDYDFIYSYQDGAVCSLNNVSLYSFSYYATGSDDYGDNYQIYQPVISVSIQFQGKMYTNKAAFPFDPSDQTNGFWFDNVTAQNYINSYLNISVSPCMIPIGNIDDYQVNMNQQLSYSTYATMVRGAFLDSLVSEGTPRANLWLVLGIVFIVVFVLSMGSIWVVNKYCKA